MEWVQFLEDNHVHYVTRGPNTRRGEVSVGCPWCGDDDPSQHLGISLSGDNWGCLRDVSHRGKSAPKLVAALVGCSFTQAKLIAAQYSVIDPDTLGAYPVDFSAPSEPAKPDTPLTLPPECQPIKRGGNTDRFWRYLTSRGFHNPGFVADTYDLSACTTGPFKDRIVMPVFSSGAGKRRLLGWQARSIGKSRGNTARYLSSHEGVKRTLYNIGRAQGGKTLFICEGPFDVIKLDFYGSRFGINAIGTFGIAVVPEQISRILEVGRAYDHTVMLFDPDAVVGSYQLLDWLAPLRPVLGSIPDGVKDPGALTREQVEELCREYTR